MKHINELIDYTVGAVIVHRNRVLFVNHRGLHKWLFPGGHIELHEDPEEALLREIREETGLDIKLVSGKQAPPTPGVKPLPAPAFMDIHEVSDTHRHVGMLFLATAATDQVKLASREHHEIQWLSESDLDDQKYDLVPSIKFYAEEALRMIGG